MFPLWDRLLKTMQPGDTIDTNIIHWLHDIPIATKVEWPDHYDQPTCTEW
jgi:hypothetical protein